MHGNNINQIKNESDLCDIIIGRTKRDILLHCANRFHLIAF